MGGFGALSAMNDAIKKNRELLKANKKNLLKGQDTILRVAAMFFGIQKNFLKKNASSLLMQLGNRIRVKPGSKLSC